MAETINMPKLGFDMAEGTLVRWVKKVGETVNKGEVLAEIETDKATVEVESLCQRAWCASCWWTKGRWCRSTRRLRWWGQPMRRLEDRQLQRQAFRQLRK